MASATVAGYLGDEFVAEVDHGTVVADRSRSGRPSGGGQYRVTSTPPRSSAMAP
jgi:hypothetical protein